MIIIPYRNPLHVAEAVATVDLVSNGRFQFGVGIGWLKEEFDALGEQFSERASAPRVSPSHEPCGKMRWPVSKGNIFPFRPDHRPLPVQKPHPPIIFGGESLPALKRVADLGDGWQPGPIPLDVLRERCDTLKALMTERGRDFSQLSISMLGDANDLKQNPEKIAALEELGVKEMVLFMAGPVAYRRHSFRRCGKSADCLTSVNR